MKPSKFADVLSSMPPLPHSVPGEPFDYDKSQVLAWIMAQPGFKAWAWNKARGTGRLAYSAATGTWSGVVRGPVGRPPAGAPTAPPDEIEE